MSVLKRPLIEKKKMSNLKSTCCKAEIKLSDLSPDFIGDNPKTMRIGTCYSVCTKCHQPCDIYSNERKFWTRNSKTQIIPDKRKKIRTKEIKKEIDSTGCA